MKIVAISDQHGFLPDIPECDVLIVAGDNCPDYPGGAKARVGSGPQVERQTIWFREVWLPWRHRQPAKMCLVTWGNHDYCGYPVMNGSQPGAPFVYTSFVYASKRCAMLDYGTIVAVDDLVQLGALRVWLTPWSSQFRDWAFMKTEEELVETYKAIPEGVDVLVSHQPPAGHGDMFWDLSTGKAEHLGSKALRAAITRVKPRVVICGHIHSGHGHETISLWNTGEGVSPGGQHVGPHVTHQVSCYNVALLNEAYKPTWEPTVIEL